MTEIGSEFWDVPTCDIANHLFPEQTQWYLSGRVALKAILKELKDLHTVAMPSWCCDSMIKPFSEAGMEVRFYPVYWDSGLIQEPVFDCDILFLTDYFGYSGEAADLGGYKGVVIRDVTHSIFSKTYSDADYYFGSLRKWCGVWTGGYAWAGDRHELAPGSARDQGYVYLRDRAMGLKYSYILGVAETPADMKREFLNDFNEAEEILESVDIVPAQKRDVWLASKLDIDLIRSKRRSNAEVLRNAFSDWLIFPELRQGDCPLFVPVLVPDGKRDALSRYLIDREIYCPIHWPVSEYHQLDDRTKYIYENELSLICDQRYQEADMLRIIASINEFMKEF